MIGAMPPTPPNTRARPRIASARRARITIWLSDDKREALEVLARESDLTLTQLARRGVDRVLAEAGAMYASDDGDAAA